MSKLTNLNLSKEWVLESLKVIPSGSLTKQTFETGFALSKDTSKFDIWCLKIIQIDKTINFMDLTVPSMATEGKMLTTTPRDNFFDFYESYAMTP